ncbi:hypothetical protein [Streptococcus infantis]|jgi:oligosaccharide repeat unit polymerase wzy|uniref:Uncharacterized protein n=1 Tax=Streptococcus infantis TaxID=68892 RepID=A0A0F3HJU9_9STRE|nr:hypothetical protein [Streptococcus infantis]KJU94466.1 hypothetical protein TZ96_00619 [Streptococcus infantis]
MPRNKVYNTGETDIELKNKYTYEVMYIISLLIVAYNIILWYWNADGTFILVIMICALEHGEQLLHQRNGV